MGSSHLSRRWKDLASQNNSESKELAVGASSVVTSVILFV